MKYKRLKEYCKEAGISYMWQIKLAEQKGELSDGTKAIKRGKLWYVILEEEEEEQREIKEEVTSEDLCKELAIRAMKDPSDLSVISAYEKAKRAAYYEELSKKVKVEKSLYFKRFVDDEQIAKLLKEQVLMTIRILMAVGPEGMQEIISKGEKAYKEFLKTLAARLSEIPERFYTIKLEDYGFSEEEIGGTVDSE